MHINALYNTSFQDIGIAHEWWILFAIIIVVNCEKNYEAALKCFVFFFISQPLIFIVEVLIGHITWDLAIHYYQIWFIPILLTLPGGFIAYYCKKENVFGDIILGLGNTLECFLGIHYLLSAINNFPRHLLSAIFCFAVIIITNTYIKKNKKDRTISLLTTILLSLIVVVYLIKTGRTF